MAIRSPASQTLKEPDMVEYPCPSELQAELYERINDELSDTICTNYFNKQSKLVRLFNQPEEMIEGHYKISSTTGDYYLKVVKNKHVKNVANANKIATLLNDKLMNSCPAINANPIKYDGGHHLFIHPWIKKDVHENNAESLYLLGCEIGKLHNNLIDIHNSNSDIKNIVEALTNARLENIQQGYDCLLYKKNIDHPEKAAVLDYLQTSPVDFIDLKERQLLHGDLNTGNIIFTNKNIYFIDFEDTHFSYLPKALELAYVIERFCVVNNSTSNAISKAEAFLKGYMTSNNNLQLGTTYSFNYCLQWLTVRSLVILSKYNIHSENWVKHEWNKFIKLINIQNKKHDVINEVDRRAKKLSSDHEIV